MDKSGVGTFINEAHEIATDAFDLFSTPPIEASLIHGKELTIYPSSVLTNEGPFTFIIPSDSTDYTFLPLTRLEGEIEITKLAGTALAATDEVTCVNLLPQSLFKQVECSINDVQINDLSTPTYHYKSFIQTHLSHGEEMKKYTLKDCELYHRETVGKENTITLADWGDSFKERQRLFIGKKIRFSIVPHIDFFQVGKNLIPGCDIKLKFIRADDNFSLIGGAVIAKIKINKLLLRVRRVTADPAYHAKVEAELSKTPAIYPVASSKIKTHLLNNGIQSTVISQIIRGKLPRHMILCFVDAKAFDSNITANPFVFEHFDVNNINVLRNGEAINPTVFQPDFDEGNFLREYSWFLDNVGLHRNATLSISKEEFRSNSCFFPFD
jgi:hypothetical protein